MTDIPENNSKPDANEDQDQDVELDLLRRLPPASPFSRRRSSASPTEEEPIEEFWATFALITPTGERYTLSACFSNKTHYNTQMARFETSKNMHIVLRDINDESLVIKRDLLLHVLPTEADERQDHKPW